MLIFVSWKNALFVCLEGVVALERFDTSFSFHFNFFLGRKILTFLWVTEFNFKVLSLNFYSITFYVKFNPNEFSLFLTIL